MQTPGRRRIWDIGLGKEVALFGYETSDGSTGPFSAGEWGMGLWMPVSFHMVEDFKDRSAPIVNTDYRFSGMFKAQIGVYDGFQFGGRLQVGHESTHLGDEFTLGAQKDETFQRVNVSYEYWEWGVSPEWRFQSAPEHHVVLRLGGIGLINDDNSFYSTTLLFPEGDTILPSTRNYETTVGFEWTLNNLTDGKKALIAGYWPFVSLDVRHRTIYDYARVDACDPEDGQWSFNVLWGLRPVCTELHSEGAPELLRSPLLRREPPRPVSKPFKLPYVRFRDARAGVMVWVALAHWLAPGRTVGAITRSPGEETSDAL